MAALALVGAVMSSCSSEDNIIDNPQQPENQSKLVTLTTTVGFGGGAGTRSLDPTTREKTFAGGDQIAVIYKDKDGHTLKAVSAALKADDISGTDENLNKIASFTVTLADPDNTKPIRYIYPAAMAKETVADDATIDDDDSTVDFTKLNNQNGSLTTLGNNLDLCTFDADDWTSGELPEGTLENQLAILAITLKDDASPTNDITSTITGMTITTSDYGDESPFSYSVTRSAADGPIYVAIRHTSYATINITATDGANYYIKTLTGKYYYASKGYPVIWKMRTWDGNLSTLEMNVTVIDGMTLTSVLSNNVKISIADGATVTLVGVSINGDGTWDSGDYAGITCLGDATIILNEPMNTVKGFNENYPGIYVPSGNTLTIQDTGSLIASSNGSGAGIGGGDGISCGNIVIESGTIEATGGGNAAGIGSGYGGNCGTITISGGNVTATGGEDAAGIGSGFSEDSFCAGITISGGTVNATGGNYGAGIGSGYYGKCGNITINGGTVIATGDENENENAAGIGSGYGGNCGTITISGGNVTATGGQYGAGIGTGDSGNCDNITIDGGTVTANGGKWAAGIGSGNGNQASCGDITIANTVTQVTATKGEDAPYSIGAGNYGTCGMVTIGGVEGAITTNQYTYPVP
jgi:hypothetical protein